MNFSKPPDANSSITPEKISHEQALEKAEREYEKIPGVGRCTKPSPVEKAFAAAVKQLKPLPPAPKAKKTPKQSAN